MCFEASRAGCFDSEIIKEGEGWIENDERYVNMVLHYTNDDITFKPGDIYLMTRETETSTTVGSEVTIDLYGVTFYPAVEGDSAGTPGSLEFRTFYVSGASPQTPYYMVSRYEGGSEGQRATAEYNFGIEGIALFSDTALTFEQEMGILFVGQPKIVKNDKNLASGLALIRGAKRVVYNNTNRL